MEDEQLFKTILNGAEEISYDGETKVGGYSHKYSISGAMLQNRIQGSGPLEMTIGEEKAEYQIANRYRGILRTSRSLKELLSPDKENPLP